MRTVVQSFALGLLTATIILGVIFYIEDGENEAVDENKIENKITKEDAEDLLKEEGYVVLDSSDYEDLLRENQQFENKINQLNIELKQMQNENQAQNDKEENTEEDTDSNPYQSDEITYELEIESGMTSIDISKRLEEEQIIPDADEFNQFLEQHGYSRLIQLGEYELSNQLSYEQIANIITN